MVVNAAPRLSILDTAVLAGIADLVGRADKGGHDRMLVDLFPRALVPLFCKAGFVVDLCLCGCGGAVLRWKTDRAEKKSRTKR